MALIDKLISTLKKDRSFHREGWGSQRGAMDLWVVTCKNKSQEWLLCSLLALQDRNFKLEKHREGGRKHAGHLARLTSVNSTLAGSPKVEPSGCL